MCEFGQLLEYRPQCLCARIGFPLVPPLSKGAAHGHNGMAEVAASLRDHGPENLPGLLAVCCGASERRAKDGTAPLGLSGRHPHPLHNFIFVQ
jgi:hypothetical protein